MALHAGDVVEIPKSNMTFCRSGMIMIARHIIHVPYIYTYINIHYNILIYIYILYVCACDINIIDIKYVYSLPGMINSNAWDVLLSHRLCLKMGHTGQPLTTWQYMAISMGKMNEHEGF